MTAYPGLPTPRAGPLLHQSPSHIPPGQARPWAPPQGKSRPRQQLWGVDCRWPGTSGAAPSLCRSHAGPLLLPKGHLCCQGQNTPRAMPGPSASPRNCPRGGCSESRRVQPGPITSVSSRPLGSPPNALMPSLEPERANPTAWTAEGRVEGREGDGPVPPEEGGLVAFLSCSPAHRH